LWIFASVRSVPFMTSIETLRAVHHPTRRRIIDVLGLDGPRRVGQLADALDEQVGSISHHLRVLERAGVVGRVPELATDGRTSWWRLEVRSLAWSVEDFADSPADRAQAKAAERVNIDHQLGRLSAWKRSADAAPASWRRAAFTTDTTTRATAEELAALHEALEATLRDWRSGIDTDDGQERRPVFVFAHGFPTAP
jgi:DNA-binding transcriptional ArsR family regulator